MTITLSRRSRAPYVASLATFAVAALVGGGVARGATQSPSYGYGDDTATTEPGETDATAASAVGGAGTAAEAMPVGGSSVGVADSIVGPILVDADGMTLYMFAKDVDGESTCAGECLENWPVAAIEGEPDVGDLDASLFSTVSSTEGATMLKVGDWPLYTFAGDAAPGDINGQAVGGVWWVVTPEGNPIAHATVVETALGPTVVNGLGMTLYAFLNDTEGVPTCAGDCLANWPAALVETGEAVDGTSVPGSAPEAEAPQLFVGDLDPALFSVVEGQLKIGDWPLYTFAGDSAPGDVNGQGVGDVWLAVGPDGQVIEA
jgi:predicted lipoprotein with Yx(FWY)xxD motif